MNQTLSIILAGLSRNSTKGYHSSI